jgi:hypothetical protein
VETRCSRLVLAIIGLFLFWLLVWCCRRWRILRDQLKAKIMSDEAASFASAYQAIGEYFCAFSALDRELGEAVKVVLGLQQHQAAEFVVAALNDVARKAKLVQAAIAVAKNVDGSETSDEWKANANNTIKQILGYNSDSRVPLAHWYLEPQADGTVRLTKPDLSITDTWKLGSKTKKLHDLTAQLKSIREHLSTFTISIPDMGWLVLQQGEGFLSVDVQLHPGPR